MDTKKNSTQACQPLIYIVFIDKTTQLEASRNKTTFSKLPEFPSDDVTLSSGALSEVGKVGKAVQYF